jgi:hypothetical protein
MSRGDIEGEGGESPSTLVPAIKESITERYIDPTISPNPSFSKRGTRIGLCQRGEIPHMGTYV